MSSSSSSSTCTFSSSPCRSSFPLSRSVCFASELVLYSTFQLNLAVWFHPGFIATYIAPLAFVLCVTMGKEAYDDYKRYLRDQEANSQKYLILEPSEPSPSSLHTRAVPSSTLRVGDLVRLEKNQRVPADLVLLRTSDQSGTCFIRTDQLDGETDWKLRVAVPACQKLTSEQDLMGMDAEIYGACALVFFLLGRVMC
jgi:magnesium-transporting ATPase (P-type)